MNDQDQELDKYQPVSLAFDVFDSGDESKQITNASPILLTHGIYMNKSLYELVAKALCQLTGRKVYTLDLRSHGESPYPKNTGVYEMAVDVIQFIQKERLERVVLVAHSFSSLVAVLVATKQPTIVESLVLVEFLPYWQDDLWMVMENRLHGIYGKLFQNMSHQLSLDEAHRIIAVFMIGSIERYEKTPNSKFLVKDQYGFRPFCDRTTLHKAVLAGHFRLKRQAVCNAPVLFVREPNSLFWKDPSIFKEHEKYFPNHEVLIIPNTTHMLPLEEPKKFAEVVQQFLEKNERKTST